MVENYKLVTGKDNSEFSYRITKLLAEGYELHGSPSITANNGGIIVDQAVIKFGKQLV